jgi:hypothetical protein
MWWKQKHPPSNSELMKHQLSVLTIIFSVVSTILTIVIVAIGIFSYNSSERIERATNELVNFERGLTKEIDNYKEKIDDKLNDKINDLEIRIGQLQLLVEGRLDTKLKDFEDRFDKLSGETLKKPNLQIKYQGKFLDQQVIHIAKSQKGFLLPQISIENNGEREVTLPSINIFFSTNIEKLNLKPEHGFIESYWEERPSSETMYPKQFEYVIYGVREDLATISPKEVDNISATEILGISDSVTEIDCMMKVYYATQPPAVARFRLIKEN